MEKVTLTTKDNIKIVGDYYPAGDETSPAVILLHMMPSTKESWDEFASLLLEKGFQVLAIDERGHGESTQGGKLDYREFSSKQQQEKMFDVLAAQDFFINKGVEIKNIVVGGASIGANLSIQYMAQNPQSQVGFALSPGFDYHGIETLPLIKKLRAGQAIYMAATKDDPNVPDSFRAVGEIADCGGERVKTRIYEEGGHGTDIFKKHPEFMDELSEWLISNITK
ncbi:MAG: alpha/beta fold hydrolase [Candidatus Spechtbacterales bacterium]